MAKARYHDHRGVSEWLKEDGSRSSRRQLADGLRIALGEKTPQSISWHLPIVKLHVRKSSPSLGQTTPPAPKRIGVSFMTLAEVLLRFETPDPPRCTGRHWTLDSPFAEAILDGYY